MPASRYWRTMLSLLVINAAANAGGAALLLFYFDNLGATTPPAPTPEASLWALMVLALIVIVGSILPARFLAPVWGWYIRALYNPGLEPAPLEVRRRALNLPGVMAAATLVLWLLAGAVLGVLGQLEPRTFALDWGAFGLKFLGVVGAIAPFTAILVYWTSEWLWQSELPLFFFKDDPIRPPAFRLPIRGRLAALGVAASAPLVLLAALVFGRVGAIVAAVPVELPPNWWWPVWAVAGGGVLVAVALAYLLGCGLTRSLEILVARMAAVQAGDLEASLPVVSNDELGNLAARFNGLVESLREREAKMQAICRLSRQMADGGEPKATLQSVLEQVRHVIPADSTEICLYDEAKDVLRICGRVPTGEGAAPAMMGQEYRLGEGYAGWVGARRRSLLIGDVGGYAEQRPLESEIAAGSLVTSYLGVPLIAAGKLVGTLALFSSRSNAFSERDRCLLEIIAPLVALAVGP